MAVAVAGGPITCFHFIPLSPILLTSPSSMFHSFHLSLCFLLFIPIFQSFYYLSHPLCIGCSSGNVLVSFCMFSDLYLDDAFVISLFIFSYLPTFVLGVLMDALLLCMTHTSCVSLHCHVLDIVSCFDSVAVTGWLIGGCQIGPWQELLKACPALGQEQSPNLKE